MRPSTPQSMSRCIVVGSSIVQTWTFRPAAVQPLGKGCGKTAGLFYIKHWAKARHSIGLDKNPPEKKENRRVRELPLGKPTGESVLIP